jgi:protein involved in polysaccharide export with SLBB domain
MTSRICARLILVAGIAALAQIQAGAQAVIDAAQSQFGAEPAPYATPSQPVTDERPVPVAQPVGGQAGYAPNQPYSTYTQPETGALGAPDPTKPLGRGDIVTFSIAQDREQPQIMRVTDTGELDFSFFPKIGRISVVGRNCAEVAAELKRKLEADYYNVADVTLGINQVNHLDSRGKVYITGNVRIPGPQDLPSSERTMVSTAIIRAGGFDKFANGHKVQVTRKDKNGNPERFTVDVKLIIERGRLDKDMELQDGDYINVPQNVVNF